MEVKVTEIVKETHVQPRKFSASAAELGQDAARITWGNAKHASASFQLNPEALQEWKDWIPDTGGWTEEDLASWDDSDFHSLFIQWVSGDFRELEGICKELEYDVFNLTDEQFQRATRDFGGSLFPNGHDWYYYIGM